MSDETKINEPRIFKVPAGNMPLLEAKLAKLVKRANKLQVPPPQLTVVGESFESRSVVVDRVEDDTGRERTISEDKLFCFKHITIQHPVVVLAGFEFISSVEHTDEGNILHTLYGKTTPPQYRDCPPDCQHCNVRRARRDTFIVRNVNTDEYKQVGSSCLKDFLGASAETVAAQAELYAEFSELCEASEGGGFGSGGESFYLLEPYLSFVAGVIAKEGWRSRSTARQYGGAATADLAFNHMCPTRAMLREGFVPIVPTDTDRQTATEAVAWAESFTDEQTAGSDYLHNLKVIASRGVVNHRGMGYGASIVSSYQRERNELKRKERANLKPSEFVGTVGERGVFKVNVDKVLTLDSEFTGRRSYLHLLSDDLGNSLVWNSSSDTLPVGETVTIRASVKAHTEYKGVRQTKLTRCQRIVQRKFVATVGADTYDIVAEDEKEARTLLLAQLGMKRLPKGATIAPV